MWQCKTVRGLGSHHDQLLQRSDFRTRLINRVCNFRAGLAYDGQRDGHMKRRTVVKVAVAAIPAPAGLGLPDLAPARSCCRSFVPKPETDGGGAVKAVLKDRNAREEIPGQLFGAHIRFNLIFRRQPSVIKEGSRSAVNRAEMSLHAEFAGEENVATVFLRASKLHISPWRFDAVVTKSAPSRWERCYTSRPQKPHSVIEPKMAERPYGSLRESALHPSESTPG